MFTLRYTIFCYAFLLLKFFLSFFLLGIHRRLRITFKGCNVFFKAKNGFFRCNGDGGNDDRVSLYISFILFNFSILKLDLT